MSIFNPLDLIIKENLDCSNVLANCKTSSHEESYFLTTLNFMTESRRQFNDANKVFYKSILESQGNQIVVHESFSGFFDTIRKIINKIIEFIKSLFNKFITALNMAIKNEKYLIKHKDDFKNFGSNHEFKFSGYTFTFSPNVPTLTTLETFNKSMEVLDASTLAGDSVKVNANIKAKYDALVASLEDRAYDLARAETLGKGNKDVIYQSDYANEIFILFRNEASSKEDIDVTSSIVTDTYSRFEGYRKHEKETQKSKDRIEKEYKAIRKQIDAAVKRSADGIEVTTGDTIGSVPSKLRLDKDVLATLDLFIKAKSNQIQELSNIHALAFAGKLDAIGDCFKQDKSLLYQALYKVQGMKKEAK